MDARTSRPFTLSMIAPGVSSAALIFNALNWLLPRSIRPCASALIAGDRSVPLIFTRRSFSPANRSTSSCGAVSRSTVPARTSPGRTGPFAVKLPSRAASMIFANSPLGDVATILPSHACQVPLPSSVAVMPSVRPDMAAITPPLGAVSVPLMDRRFCSGTASSFACNRSPLSTMASADRMARPSEIWVTPSIAISRFWPMTGLASTNLPIFIRSTSISRSGRIGALGSLATTLNCGLRARTTSGVSSRLTEICLLM